MWIIDIGSEDEFEEAVTPPERSPSPSVANMARMVLRSPRIFMRAKQAAAV